MIVKEHKSKSGIIVSICDEEIIGKKYSENGLVLDLGSDFYAGKRAGDSESEKKCKNAYIINAVGKKSVGLLLKMKIVDEKNIMKIKGIPFAQCLLLQNEV